MNDSNNEIVTIPRGHIPALDGIRGIAVLMVMVFHFSIVTKHEQLSARIDDWYQSVTFLGWMGVELFFVLSGFLITGILLKTKSSSNYFKAFYMRRALRIFPLYYGFLAVMIFGLIPLANAMSATTSILDPIVTQMGDLQDKQAWFWLYASNIYTFVHDGEKAVNGMGHFWSLAIEEQYYLIWTPLVFVLNPKRLAIACVALIAAVTAYRIYLVSIGTSHYTISTFTATRVDTIIYGSLGACLLYQGIPERICKLMRKSIIPLWIIGLGAQIAQGSSLGATDWSLAMSPTILSIIFTITVLGVATVDRENPTKLVKALTFKPLVHLGTISYGLYVFHVPLRGAFLPLYEKLVPKTLIAGSQLHWTLGFVALGLIASLVIAQLSWWFFESPILKLKKRFEYKKNQDNATPPPPPNPTIPPSP